MKKLFFFIISFHIIIFLSESVNACKTTIPAGSIINQVWTVSGSPYCITGDIQVNSLEIKSGVEVVFLGNYVFEVVGTLKAIGTEHDQIVFTSAETNEEGWQGIFFNRSFPETELIYCKVEKSHNSGIEIYSTSPSIQYCTISNNTALYGAGIKISGVLPVTLSDCSIRENGFEGRHPRGGGIYTTTPLTMVRCEVVNNSIVDYHSSCWDGSDASTLGGGIYSTADLVLQKILIMGNVASSKGGGENSRGGGIYSGGTLSLQNCIIAQNSASAGGCNMGNQARGYGGGIYIGSTVSMKNCIVTQNYTRTSGGGIFAESDAHGVIENCTIGFENSPGGIYVSNTDITLMNSIIYFNSSYQIYGNLDTTYCNVEGGLEGEGNIDKHPLLILDPDNPDALTIPENSSCVDAGNPDSQYNDICFPPSLGSEQNDMGAHGGPSACGWNPLHIDIAYAIRVLQVMAGMEPQNINKDIDINNDGKIGIEEIIYILQVASGFRKQ